MNRYLDFYKYTAITADEERPRHSEASIIELKDGSLLMAWQCHLKSGFGSGDEAPSNISLMNSYDGARTWVNERIVAEMKGNCINVYSPSFLRNKDGSISLYFKRYINIDFHSDGTLNNYYRITSYDEGKTWSEEETIWEMSKFGVMNHAIKRLSDGSALMPLEGGNGGWRKDKPNYEVFVMRSEDDFKTFTESERMTVPMRGLMEPCIAERSDGSLNMVFRTQLGSIFYSESFDKGRTWTNPQTTGLHAPESCPCIVSIPNTDAQLIIWNNSEYDMKWRSHYGKRTPLTMAISTDGLKTFGDFFDIETDPNWAFTNPSVTVTSDGLFVLNYWACKYNEEWLFGPLIDLKIATFRINCEGLRKEEK